MWNTWTRELFINLLILITLIFIGSQFFMAKSTNKLTILEKKLGLGILGGEEFCIILKFPSSNFTLEVAERIRSTVEKHKFFIDEDKSTNITISIGASIYPDTISDVETIKEISDKNLYKAKNSGRNKIIS